MISRTVLIACDDFDGLSARRVASAIGRGLSTAGWQDDLCPIAARDEHPLDLRLLLDELDLDARMLRARAVILGAGRLEVCLPAQSATLEIATRARQAGVPAYAVTAKNMLDAFYARMFDLQLVIEASSSRALQAAGARLAELI